MECKLAFEAVLARRPPRRRGLLTFEQVDRYKRLKVRGMMTEVALAAIRGKKVKL